MQAWQDGTPQDQTDPQEWGGRFAPPARGARMDADIPSGVIPLAYRVQQEPQNIKPAARPFFCADCGGREFWQLPGGRWMCSSCRPQPKAYARPEPITATTPAAEPITAQAMPQAPEPAAIQATTQTDEPQPPALFFPESVNHYALLSVQAASTKGAAGGYRLWILAKTLDQKGEGNVKRDDLRAYTDYLGVTVRTWQRWVNEARTMGFVQDIQTDPSKGGKWLFVLASYQRAAAALFEQSVINQRESIEKIQQSAISDQQKQARLKRVRACNVASMGTRKATIPAVDFVGDGWRARVWASYEKLFREKPITRAKLQQLTQIPARTQYHHEKTAGVKVVHSYAKTTYTKDQAHGLREHSNHKGLFVGFNGDVLFALPNVYRYEPATIGARGRARKVNKKLSALLGQEGLSHRRRALTSNNELDQATDKFLYRLFNVTDKQFKATRKKIRDQKPTGGDVYAYPKGARSGALMWEHAHACDYLPRVEA